jgi:phosphoglycerate kinase
VTHLGKPKGPDPKLTLDPVAARLSELVGKKVTKVDEVVGESVKKAVGAMKNGDIVLLENVRFNPGETKNKPEFVKQLVDCIHPDIYVNDAFGTAHRAHASTVGVTAYTKVNLSGLLMDKELKFLYGAIDNPKRPLAAIVGGAKVSTKLPVLESLIDKCDKLLVGGGMMFTFYKAMGKNIGKSIVENDQLDLALKLMDKAKTKGIEFMLPVDTVVTDSLDKQAVIKTVDVDHIPSDCLGADIGPKTIAAFQKTLEDANTIVWNGPMGIFEQKNFAAGTMAIAKTLAERSDKGAITIVGGGDSVSAINKSGVANKITHISTGGGASLEVLEGKILPGVAALTDA